MRGGTQSLGGSADGRLVKEVAARRLGVYVVAPKYQVSDAGKSNSRTVRVERAEVEGARLVLRD